MAGVRAILAPPPLPRLTSRDAAPDEPQDAPGRALHRRDSEAVGRRAPRFDGASAAPIRPAPESASRVSRPGIAFVPPKRSPTVSPAPGAKPPAVIDRIVEDVRLRACSGTRIRIALSPEHLGELLIELTLRGSLLEGEVRAESDAARDLIDAHLGQLRDALDGQGIRLGEFRVTVDRPLGSAPPETSSAPAATAEEEEPVRRPGRRLIDLLA